MAVPCPHSPPISPSFLPLPLSFICLPAPRLIFPSTLSLPCSCFPHLLSFLYTESIVIGFISLSVSFFAEEQLFGPELKVTYWLGQGLQHRTWVLPVLPTRVLCCSQWSCLESNPSQDRWMPPAALLLTPLVTPTEVLSSRHCH